MVRNILGTFGYEVTITADGKAAIDEYRKALNENKRFDLVILDLTVLGGMGGEKAIQELKKIDPDVIAIVSSGYSDNPILAEFPLYGFSGMVSKPYRTDELLLAVKRLVEKTKKISH
jgi:CheY-like chemotaxis protein